MAFASQKGKNLIRLLLRSWPVALLLVCLAVIIFRASRPDSNVTIDVLDIGQGDAILVQDGFTQMLIDGGPDASVLGQLGDAMPFFDHTIEVMVLTHPHADHYAGLIAVLARYRVKQVLVASRHGDGREYDNFEKAVIDEGAKLSEVGAGDSFLFGARTNFKVLWPPEAGVERTKILAMDDRNMSSVVLRMDTVGGAALLTGDATPEVERALVASGVDLRADFLKVAHHGSRYSSTLPFLQKVRPSYAAISVGVGNSYGHPAWMVIRRLESLGAGVFRTDQDGAVRVKFSPDGIEVSKKGKKAAPVKRFNK